MGRTKKAAASRRKSVAAHIEEVTARAVDATALKATAADSLFTLDVAGAWCSSGGKRRGGLL